MDTVGFDMSSIFHTFIPFPFAAPKFSFSLRATTSIKMKHCQICGDFKERFFYKVYYQQ